MISWVFLLILLAIGRSASLTRPVVEQEEPLFTPLKLQYVAPKAFLTSAGLIAAPRLIQTGNDMTITPQHAILEDNKLLPLTAFTVPLRAENYLSQQRTNRLPPNNLLPELQFADRRGPTRILPIIPNMQASALLSRAYQPGYVMMAMPPSSYTAVTYYNDEKNDDNQQEAHQRSSLAQPENDDARSNSKSKIVQRSNSDTISAPDSSSDFSDSTKTKAFSVSYKDNHVQYSY